MTQYEKKKEERYQVIMLIDWQEYLYGTYDDRDRANEIALQVAQERNIYTEVQIVD